MSTRKRSFEDVGSTTPGTEGNGKRLASSSKSLLQAIPNNYMDGEFAGSTPTEITGLVSKASDSSLALGRASSQSPCGLSPFQHSQESNLSEDEICYGMACLQDGRFTLLRNSERPESWVAEGPAPPAHAALGIRFWRANAVTVLSPNSEEIGVLDVKTATALRQLRKVSGAIRFSLFLSGRGDERHQNVKKKPPTAMFSLDINIYGAPRNLRKVGETLSEAGLFLQEPIFLDTGVVYQNPHFFSWDEETTTPRLAKRKDLSGNDFANIIEETMNCSNAILHPPIFSQDRRIMTPLKRHQVDAVQFMMAREGQFENDLSLWEPSCVNGRKAFIHKITREVRGKQPRECLGGILADEMGMGKSLTLLALIAQTLERSNISTQKLDRTTFRDRDELPSRATLIITPKSTLYNWEIEIKRHLSPDLRWFFYRGRGLSVEPPELAEHDIVCTTYETVFHDTKRSAILQAVPRFRVALDEAHHIRNRTKSFRAVMNLRTQRKWCLTGTPVQNSLDDLFSLTEFLGFHPVENRLNARRWILEPLGAKDEKCIENLGSLLRSIALRRSRDSERNGRRSEHEVKVILSSAERELYNSTRSKAKTCLSSHDRFSYILKMRQLCSHGLLGRDQALENKNAAREVDHGPTVCHGCGEDLSLMPSRNAISKSSDTPQLCFECADEQGDIANSITESSSLQDSPFEIPCTPVSGSNSGILDGTGDDDVDMDRDLITPAKAIPSAKLHTVLGNLLKLQQRCHQDATPIKSLVFSFWTTTLDALESMLLSHHMSYSRIDGSRSLEQRRAAIHNFRADPDIRIMLLSFGTGSVGLNLTPATHVHLIEPQWNPMVELQAAARVDRLDQENDVVILRYIVEESIEKLIRARQNRKLWLANLTTSSSSTVANEADIVDDPDL